MEIEKDIIRLSPQDVHDAYAFAAFTGDTDNYAFAEALARKLGLMETDPGSNPDYRVPVIEVPYSIKVVEFMNRAARHAIEQTRISLEEITGENSPHDIVSLRKEKRQKLANEVVVNLAVYRRQKRRKK